MISPSIPLQLLMTFPKKIWIKAESPLNALFSNTLDAKDSNVLIPKKIAASLIEANFPRPPKNGELANASIYPPRQANIT